MNQFINQQDNSLLSISDAARILHVSIDTLRNWDASGKLKAFRTLGSQRRYRLSDVQLLLQAHQTSHPLPHVPHHTHLAPNHRGPWLGATIGIGTIITVAMFFYIYTYTTQVLFSPKHEILSENSTQIEKGSVIGAQTEALPNSTYQGGVLTIPKNTTENQIQFSAPFDSPPVISITSVLQNATESAQLSQLTQVGVTNVTTEGFTVIRSSPLPIRSTYYWTAFSQ